MDAENWARARKNGAMRPAIRLWNALLPPLPIADIERLQSLNDEALSMRIARRDKAD